MTFTSNLGEIEVEVTTSSCSPCRQDGNIRVNSSFRQYISSF